MFSLITKFKMFENTIEEILKRDPITNKYFLGVFARNELPQNFSYPACFVLNTEDRTKSGEHWLAIHYNENGYCNFFDSYGLPPAYYKLETYLKKTSSRWTWNMKRVQGLSQYCGFYCVFYLLLKCRGRSDEFFEKFNSNLNQNDTFISNQIKNFKK